MKRVTKKVRKVRSKGARAHLVFTSAKHAEDKAAADRLREPKFVPVPSSPLPKREPFPWADDVSFQAALITDADGIRLVRSIKQRDYEQHLATAARDASVWYVATKKLKKNGQPQMQKRKGQGLSDCYFAFPPWVSQYLADLADAGRLKYVKEITRKAVTKAAATLENRTGYNVVGLALHPDSRGVLGFHVQYQTAANGKLLGRSAMGKKGGLRLAGDAMSAVARYSQFVTVKDTFGVLGPGRDYDDLAINRVVDEFCKTELGPEWAKVEAKAHAMAEDWKRRRDEALNPAPPEIVTALEQKIAGLKQEMALYQTALTREVELRAASDAAERQKWHEFLEWIWSLVQKMEDQFGAAGAALRRWVEAEFNQSVNTRDGQGVAAPTDCRPDLSL